MIGTQTFEPGKGTVRPLSHLSPWMKWSLTHCLYLEPHVSRSLIIGRPLHLLQMVTKGWEPDRIPVQYAHHESPGGGAIPMQGWAAVGQPNKNKPKQHQALGLFCCTLKCFSVQWQSVPLVPATQEAEAEGLLMSRNSKPVWTTEQDPCLKTTQTLTLSMPCYLSSNWASLSFRTPEPPWCEDIFVKGRQSPTRDGGTGPWHTALPLVKLAGWTFQVQRKR